MGYLKGSVVVTGAKLRRIKMKLKSAEAHYTGSSPFFIGWIGLKKKPCLKERFIIIQKEPSCF